MSRTLQLPDEPEARGGYRIEYRDAGEWAYGAHRTTRSEADAKGKAYSEQGFHVRIVAVHWEMVGEFSPHG